MKNKTMICPKCGSIDIRINPDYFSAIIGVTPIESQCNNCGYSSKVFPHVDIKDINKYRSNLKRLKRKGMKK